MAQSTAGIKLYWGTSVVTDNVPAIPVSWTEIPDITSTPALGSAPAQLDSTTLAQTVMKTYIAGLQDLGNLEFGANFTPALITQVTAAVADAGAGNDRAFKISFPAPVEKGYWWTGTIQNARPAEASVDAVATTTLYVTVETEIQEVDESVS